MNRNVVALGVLLVVLVVFPAGLFGYQSLRTQAAGVRVIDLSARSPEAGGFSPDHLELRAGETVRLRISSPDVVHGFSIPGLGVQVEEILPGKPVEVEITPQEAGRFAFACTRWCSVDHWRMRGTIDVVAAEGKAVAATPAAPEAPSYQRLGIDLDAPHPRTDVIPAGGQGGRPSAARGARLGVALPPALSDARSRLTVSPAAGFERMRQDPSMASLSDAEVWDLVALAWLNVDDVPQLRLDQAREWFSRDCAACHGPEGRGDGPAGRKLPGLGGGSMADPNQPSGPADFTNLSRVLAMDDARLQGKILRGGMGTGMPEFGSLYTEEQIEALVVYIRTFAFDK